MTDLADLVRAVVENPQEDTPVSMLADHLIEQGGGRGDILRHWVANPHNRLKGRDWYGRPLRNPNSVLYFPEEQTSRPDPPETIAHDDDSVKNKETGLRTWASVGPGDDVYWAVVHQLPYKEVNTQTRSVPARSLYVKIPSAEARSIADRLPNAEEVHKFLDAHFGPDPRFTEDLNKTLKPKGE